MRNERWAAATFATSCAAAWLIPGVRPGIGLVIVALCIAGVLYLGAERVDRKDVAFFTLALALSSSAVLRDATWIVAIDLLVAAGLAVVAVVDAKTFREIAMAPLRVLGSVRSGLGWMVAPIGATLWSADRGRLGPVAVSTGAGFLLVLVFGILFTSADAAFAAITRDVLVPDWDVGLLPVRAFVGLVTALACAALVAAGRSSGGPSTQTESELEPRRVAEWAIPVVMLDVLFAAFVLVQLAVMFGDRRHVLATEGLTYAEYARQGFFQLLAVAALTLAVIGTTVWFARARAGTERLWLRVLLGPLCAFTLVILLSAGKRLTLYEAVYGFTRLRLSVHATIWWLGLLFSFVILAGVIWRGSWLPRTACVSAAIGLVLFTAINPDGWIAERNLEHFGETDRLDAGYLSTLSADAVPALSAISDPGLRDCILSGLAERRDLSQPDPWNGWNLSRSRARDLVAKPLVC